MQCEISLVSSFLRAARCWFGPCDILSLFGCDHFLSAATDLNVSIDHVNQSFIFFSTEVNHERACPHKPTFFLYFSPDKQKRQGFLLRGSPRM